MLLVAVDAERIAPHKLLLISPTENEAGKRNRCQKADKPQGDGNIEIKREACADAYDGDEADARVGANISQSGIAWAAFPWGGKQALPYVWPRVVLGR